MPSPFRGSRHVPSLAIVTVTGHTRSEDSRDRQESLPVPRGIFMPFLTALTLQVMGEAYPSSWRGPELFHA